MLSICKIFTFHAAHKLPSHPGHCRNIHGHSYKLEVEIATHEDPPQETGMLMDFQDLKALVQARVIDVLDHAYINDIENVPYYVSNEPTAENMVLWIRNTISEALIGPHDLFLKRVRLSETDTCYAEWNAETNDYLSNLCGS